MCPSGTCAGLRPLATRATRAGVEAEPTAHWGGFLTHRNELACARLLLTHMNNEVLALDELGMPERAWDGAWVVPGAEPILA